MAIPLFRSAGAQIGSITTITPGAPTGLAIDDVELLLIETANQVVTLTTAAGFAEVLGSPVGVGTAGDAIATRLTLFWRRWDGVAGDPTTNDPGNHVIGIRVAFSGVITTGDPWDITVASSELTEDTTGSADGGTTTVADCLIVLCGSKGKPDTVSTTEVSAQANADLANVTERVDDADNSGNGGHQHVTTGEKATAGLFGATTYTAATASAKAHLIVALKPPPPAGPPPPFRRPREATLIRM